MDLESERDSARSPDIETKRNSELQLAFETITKKISEIINYRKNKRIAKKNKEELVGYQAKQEKWGGM